MGHSTFCMVNVPIRDFQLSTFNFILVYVFGKEFYEDHVPGVGATIKWMGGQDLDYGPIAAMISFSLLVIGLAVFGVSAGQILSVFFALTPIWLPALLFYIFFNKWMDMVGAAFSLNQGRTTLRLRLPPEVFKSPEAMEFVIAQIHNTASPDNLMQTYLDGKRPLPFCFEIASIGGEVRFYVNVPTKKTKDAFEANIYAQYPGIEVIEEAVDYAAEIPVDYESEDYQVMSFHMGKKKDGVMPIKTYIDFGMDKLPKEEEKVDPITPMIEVMANIKPYERVFMQIVARSFRVDSFKNGQMTVGEGPDWTKGAEEEINKVMNRDPKKKIPLSMKGEQGEDGDERGQMAMLTMGEKDKIAAIERNMGKYAYETSIRWLYVTKKGKFNGDFINPMIRSFSQYDLIGRNAIGVRWRTDFGYKNLFPGGKKKELKALTQQEIIEYRRRLYYPKSGADNYKIFTSEELATMFHMPGKVAMTPTLDRVPSTRGEPPANLPIGSLSE